MTDDVDSRALMARISKLFEDALALAPQERSAWLADLEDHKTELGRELRSLLKAHDSAGDFLADQASATLRENIAHAGHDEERLPEDGARIGPYRIVRELARGGMGIVYIADRADDQFEQRVALKLIRRGLDSEALRDRFMLERQILAQLDHPYIARLQDGGITADGQPWFAMEYVEGQPLHEYCKRNNPGLDARLNLFLDICEAVRHAHSKLVVHRDLKPNNILITAAGTPKLLDFGIAKLLELDGIGADTRLTQLGLRPLTPEYAAPEQIRGDAVTTAVDVYALGTLLYEMLSGRLPLNIAMQDPLAVAKTICDTQPIPPSRALTTAPARARRVRGDLDDIVMKALRKEPERRYGTVDALAEDLRRHKNGLPVSARPDSLRYRSGKFVRRHRFGVTAATVILLLLVGGMATTAWQARIAAFERDHARQEAAKAEQVKDLVIGLFEQADPTVSASGDVTVREMLDSGVERARSDLEDQPEIQAEIFNTIGVSYRALGRYDDARTQLQAALANRRALWPQGHEDLAVTLNDLANVYHYQGEYDEAAALYDETLAMRRELFGEHHPAIADTINDLGILRYQQGDLHAAEPLYRQAYEIRLIALGEMHQHTLTSEHNLGGLLQSLGRYDDAREVMMDNVRKWRALHGKDHPDIADAANELARIHLRMNEFDAADTLFQEALSIRRKVYPKAHPSIASSLNSIAALKSDLGEFVEAELLMRETLALDKELLGAEHPYVAGDMQRLADALAQQKRFDEALPIFLRRSPSIGKCAMPIIPSPRPVCESTRPLWPALDGQRTLCR